MTRPYGNARAFYHLIWKARDVVGLTRKQTADLFGISMSRVDQITYSERDRRGSNRAEPDAVGREDG